MTLYESFGCLAANEIAEKIIESDLAPHPNHRGRLPISTDTQNDHRGTHYSSLTIRPGAGNVIHLSVERHQTTTNQSVQSNQKGPPFL